MKPSIALFIAPVAFALAACSVVSDPTGSSESFSTSCEPSLTRYPVAGPHNGGYDDNWATWTCEGANDNSDFSLAATNETHQNGHLGNDIFGARGTPIVVAKAGRVTMNAPNAGGGGGNRVAITDDCGWTYYYAHLDTVDPNAVVGTRLEAGAPVGTLGNTGSASSTEPHLHFSLYPGEDYNSGISPFDLLQSVKTTACAAVDPYANVACAGGCYLTPNMRAVAQKPTAPGSTCVSPAAAPDAVTRLDMEAQKVYACRNPGGTYEWVETPGASCEASACYVTVEGKAIDRAGIYDAAVGAHKDPKVVVSHCWRPGYAPMPNVGGDQCYECAGASPTWTLLAGVVPGENGRCPSP